MGQRKRRKTFYLFEKENLLGNCEDQSYIQAFPIFSKQDDTVRVNINNFRRNKNWDDCIEEKPIIYISEYKSRGSYTYHFGHFIIDILPLLIDIDLIKRQNIFNCFDPKLIAYPLKKWNYEILKLIKRSEFADLMVTPKSTPLVQLNKNTKNKPSYSVSQHEILFLKQKETRKLSILSKGFSSKSIFNYQPNKKNILVLSRESKSNNLIQRWTNEKECMQALELFNVKFVEPSSIGPLGLIELINIYAPSIILGSAGSAFHQLLMFDYIPSIVSMIVSGRNESTFWHDQIKDFRYATNRMNVIYPYKSKPQDWNDLFSLKIIDFVQLITKLQDYEHKENITLKVNSIVARGGNALSIN